MPELAPKAFDQRFGKSTVVEDDGTHVFAAWFRQSKVVDAQGVPLVVYHGTRSGVDSLIPGERGTIHFSSDPALASRYATDRTPDYEAQDDSEADVESEGAPNVVPAYLSLQNPFDPESEAHLEALGGMRQMRGDWVTLEHYADKIESLGFDGIMVDGMRDIAVFRPEQIKSAIGNDGTFDSISADIARNSVRTPSWFASGRKVAGDHDALEEASGDAPYMLENEDLTMDWRIASVPVDAVIDDGKAPEPDRLNERLGLILSAPRLERPIYKLMPDGRAKIIDGWHRLQVSKARGEKTVDALVGKAPCDIKAPAARVELSDSREEAARKAASFLQQFPGKAAPRV